MTVSKALLEKTLVTLGSLMPGAKHVPGLDVKTLNEVMLELDRAVSSYDDNLTVEREYLQDALRFFGSNTTLSDKDIDARTPALMRRVVRSAAYAHEGGASEALSELQGTCLDILEAGDVPGNHSGLCQTCVKIIGVDLASRCAASRPDPGLSKKKGKQQ